MGKVTAFSVADRLVDFARRNGYVAPGAYYIRGEFNLRDAAGDSIYSDEAHLWCEPCGSGLLTRALALIPESEREDHFLCPTDADNEDTCPHCMACGETLRGTVSSYAVAEELAHYAEHPIHGINPRQAVELAQILNAAPDDPAVLALGKSALAFLTPAGRAVLEQDGGERS